MENKDDELKKYINEIKTVLPKNMKKDKIKHIEYLISKIHSINSDVKKNRVLKIRFSKSKNIVDYNGFNLILEKFLKVTVEMLEEDKITFKISNFSNYIEKTHDKYHLTYPDVYFMNIGKKIINNIQSKSDYVYDTKFIEKGYIHEETTSSYSFNCIYIDNMQENIRKCKIILHIIQYNDNYCFLKIMPNAYTTNKSIYLKIENNIEHKLANLKI